MKRVNNFLLGSDTELFVMDKQTGKILDAKPFVKGSKHKPFRFDPDNKYFATSLDCVNIEFNVAPAKTIDEWRNNMQKALNYCSSILPDTLCTVAQSSFDMDEDQLTSREANIIGCEPSYLVWDKSIAEKPDISKMKTRAAALHLHFGYDLPPTEEEYQELAEDIVKVSDIFLGVPSILIEPENKRRELYGQAGEFRFCREYGVEYRVLGNYFASSPELLDWTYNQAQKAIEFINNESMQFIESKKYDILDAINGGNKKIARRLVDEFEIELV